jgi:hypothetical protein
MGEPMIEITGPEAEEAGRELQALLRETFGEEGRRIATPEADTSGRKIDPATLALVTFIVALPGAIRNTLDLAEKMKLIERIQRLIAWARGRGKSGTRIALVSSSGTSVDLTQVEPADVVALSEAKRDAEASATR